MLPLLCTKGQQCCVVVVVVVICKRKRQKGIVYGKRMNKAMYILVGLFQYLG